MTRSEKIHFVIVRSIGNFLLLFALYGVGATFGPVLYHELQFRLLQARGVEFAVDTGTKPEQRIKTEDKADASSSGPGFAEILAGKKEYVLTPKDTQFSILIPKLGASAKVFPNVDPGNPQEFLPVLQYGVAHAKGTVFPGMQGNTYLFAHSTDNWWNVGRYNALFYLLKDLAPGDEIIVFFEDRRYNYVVDRSFIAEPTDVSFLTNESGPEQLILQTCWPPGTTWKRLFVVAIPKEKAQK